MPVGALSTKIDDVFAWAEKNSVPSFRVKQFLRWIYSGVTSYDCMTDLSKDLRQRFADEFPLETAEIRQEQLSKDGTRKFVTAFADGQAVESVLMSYKHGNTVCISTQAGCKMGCRFCASPPAGFYRNLTAGEMLAQVFTAGKYCDGRVDNVVLMGIGEPLDNFDNVCTFLENLSDARGYQMSLRHVSLSTCGMVDKIKELATKRLQLTLSISLHAPNNEIRNKLMPINIRWGMTELFIACDDYFHTTGRRICYEYALIKGVNDSEANARELASRLSGKTALVNLIPYNPVDGTGYQASTADARHRFKAILEQSGINVTIRRTLGSDLNASCGQLRLQQS